MSQGPRPGSSCRRFPCKGLGVSPSAHPDALGTDCWKTDSPSSMPHHPHFLFTNIHFIKGSLVLGPEGRFLHLAGSFCLGLGWGGGLTFGTTRDDLWRSRVRTRSCLQSGNTTQRQSGMYTLSRLRPYSAGATACAEWAPYRQSQQVS